MNIPSTAATLLARCLAVFAAGIRTRTSFANSRYPIALIERFFQFFERNPLILQGVARIENPRVAGSIPAPGTI
jgi:hypothetical protein